MPETIAQKMAESHVIQDAVPAVLGVTMTATGSAGLAGKIDLANNIVSLGLAVAGLFVTILTAANLYYKLKQRKFDYYQSIKRADEGRRNGS